MIFKLQFSYFGKFFQKNFGLYYYISKNFSKKFFSKFACTRLTGENFVNKYYFTKGLMSVSIDKNLCIGCSACASLCPKTFKMNEEEGKAEVIAFDDITCAQSAADGCPAQAIAIG